LQDSEEDCFDCDAGKHSTNGECIACVLGKYSTGGTACAYCPPGKTVASGVGYSIDACTDCPVGQHSVLDGTHGNIGKCKPCPAGKTVSGGGYLQDFASDCTLCDDGQGIDANGACSACPDGKYSVTDGVCKPCTNGRSNTGGANAGPSCADVCDAGKYASGTECKNCPIGK